MNDIENFAAQTANSFAALADFIRSEEAAVKEIIELAGIHNPWFIHENTHAALEAIAFSLKKGKVKNWLESYPQLSEKNKLGKPKRIGMVLAGNIPAVGFHDILCVLASGNHAVIKLSKQDNILIPFLLSNLTRIDPFFEGRYEIQERLASFDAVIATGSTNSSRYFEYYFGKHPNIIRKNRNSVAVLTGTESDEELQAIGSDLFLYYGLGCRNVSKLYIPRGYNFDRFFLAIEPWRRIMDLHKYVHNYDYQLTLVLLNSVYHLTNGFVILTENTSFHSPISVLHYEYYEEEVLIEPVLDEQIDQLQCIVSKPGIHPLSQAFGSTQKPELWDYADRLDTMTFLAEI